MKNKPLRENYTGVCLYCGNIFRSNRSSALYCPNTSHRQMHGKNRSLINPLLEDENGNLINADHLLRSIYNDRLEKNKDGWSSFSSELMLRECSAYTGPLPKGAELLVVASFVIRQLPSYPLLKPRFQVKPIDLLTPEEKGSKQFISAKDVLENKGDNSTGSINAADSEE